MKDWEPILTKQGTVEKRGEVCDTYGLLVSKKTEWHSYNALEGNEERLIVNSSGELGGHGVDPGVY